MGLHTLADYLSALSPMIWTCIAAIVLIAVVVRVVILPILED